MKDKNIIYWVVIIGNTLAIICFTILAVIFHKWWIVFFSLLFQNYITQPQTYYRICDGCGKHSEYTNSYNNALEKAKNAGWIMIKNNDKWHDYCPECQKSGKDK